MKILVACKRGNIAERDKWGHCLCQDCKEHRRVVQKQNRSPDYQLNWQRNNKEKVSAYSKKWINNNQDQWKAIVKSWRILNPDKVKLMNQKGGRKWAKRNKSSKNASSAKRRASIINRTPIWVNLDKIKEFYLEADKLTQITGIPHEVDHIIPLQGEFVSGLHVHTNLRIITRSENRSKGNKFGGELCEFL